MIRTLMITDCETTGLSHETDRAIEDAAALPFQTRTVEAS